MQPHTSFSLLIDIIATAATIVFNTHDIIRKRVNMASTDTKRRKRRPYENKALIMEHLGFGREQSFDDWRASDLVKPHGERFSKHFLDSPFFKSDKKHAEFKRVYTQIINGEKGGAMTFSTRTNC